MRNDRIMKIVIASILVLFTTIQVFYFAQIDIMPTGIFTYITLMNMIYFILEVCLMVGLSILITYILPIICIVETTKLIIVLGNKKFPLIIRQYYKSKSVVFVTKNMVQKLQVIRC